MNEANLKRGVQCKSIFKNKDNIKMSINILWAEIISILENSRESDYNIERKGHTHRKDEVGGE